MFLIQTFTKEDPLQDSSEKFLNFIYFGRKVKFHRNKKGFFCTRTVKVPSYIALIGKIDKFLMFLSKLVSQNETLSSTEIVEKSSVVIPFRLVAFSFVVLQ